MLEYTVSYKNPNQKFIDIELIIRSCQTKLTLQLPAWRPGRYELQNYARNLLKFTAFDQTTGKALRWQKTTRENWEIIPEGAGDVVVRYSYYANQMDAGGCWLDEEQLYINFINCLMYPMGKEQEPCAVILKLADNYQIATGLKHIENKLTAPDFFRLADSPTIASAHLQHNSYTCMGTTFHLWILGEVEPDWNKIIGDFEKYTKEQITTMGDFPEENYHFLYQILPYKHHHGVEHRNSTIITLGPAESFHSDHFYTEFLSISSHELFHTWNIARIRPVEMMPYDLTKENYFRTGFVAEGITTYYGEYFLARAGVFTQDQYFHELNGQIKKHFENFGNYNLSLADSSFDLWVDGYVQGIPNRKVSIYTKGAIAALILDLELRKATGNKGFLDTVMKTLWNDFGKKDIGYSLEDFQKIVEAVGQASFESFFEECILGTTDLKERIQSALNYIGCELQITDSKTVSEKFFGFKAVHKEGRVTVEQIEPGSPADFSLSKDDEIVAVNRQKVTSHNLNDLLSGKTSAEIALFRKHKLLTIALSSGEDKFFKNYRIIKNSQANQKQKENFQLWLNQPF